MAAMARRLSLYLPPAELKTVMGALVRGRLGYASAVLTPRLKKTDPLNAQMCFLQTAVNDVGRAMIGSRRRDMKNVKEVLEESGMPSVNKLIVKAIGTACWKALKVTDTVNGPLNPLGNLLLSRNPSSSSANPRRTRAGLSGCLPPLPPPPAKTKINSFVWRAHLLWNGSPSLRSAPTLSAASRAANDLAVSAPQ